MTWILAMEPFITTVLANSTSYQNPSNWFMSFFAIIIIVIEMLFTGVFFLVWIGLFALIVVGALVAVISFWKIFEKAGKPGWAALIPYYNGYVQAEICFGNGIYFLFLFV
ncbi:MAG: hypothetical protein J5825_07610, partial [Lachnospiraceae bacterium]|nr:hypothetical protein [Lachnospiraceae bacterium]